MDFAPAKDPLWSYLITYSCPTCRFYFPTAWGGYNVMGQPDNQGKCRRRAPVIEKGYPVVYYNDWCGEHKLGTNPEKDRLNKEGEEWQKLATQRG